MNQDSKTSLNHQECYSDIDGVLQQFFHAEMPQPWPSAPVVEKKHFLIAGTGIFQGQLWKRLKQNLTIAASVALLITGYLAISAKFPARSGVTELNNDEIAPVKVAPNIASDLGKVSNRYVVPTPAGNRVEVQEQETPDNGLWMNLRRIETPNK